MTDINWLDSKCKITEHFTVKEALWMPQLGRMANENDGLDDSKKNNLILLCNKLEVVREFFNNNSININSMYRSPAYSKMVGGFYNDVHTLGQAVDFTISTVTALEAISLIVPMLETWNMRMEDNPINKSYVHLDIHPVINKRFFKP